MHLLFSTSRATLQALHPSAKSGLSAEDLQPAEGKTKHFSLYKCFTDWVLAFSSLSIMIVPLNPTS